LIISNVNSVICSLKKLKAKKDIRNVTEYLPFLVVSHVSWIMTGSSIIPIQPYSKKIQNYHIQHKNNINGNVWELHTEDYTLITKLMH
jgi:hypothetical protein